LGKPLLEIETELARQRQQATIPKEGQKGFQPVLVPNETNITSPNERKAAAQVAKTIGRM
jgi:hypothetical protein